MILSVNQIHKSYGKEKVLKGVSFKIEEPKIIALVGPNGSGKSTLLNIITNILPANSGEVIILNKRNQDPDIFREISFMQDNTVLYDYLTGYDHLQFIGDLQGISKRKIMETAERVGMDKYIHKKVGKYSLGMKQHLLFTMAIVNSPKLLILDEPLNGLDPSSAIKVRELLLELFQEGTTILLSSHNLGEIDRVTSDILFLKNGNLIEEDISLYEKISYAIMTSNNEKAQQLLVESGYHVEEEAGKLLIYMEEPTLKDIFQLLEVNEVDIQDMEKKTFGSEERYQKIFSGNGEKE